jgi:hypothetical protein
VSASALQAAWLKCTLHLSLSLNPGLKAALRFLTLLMLGSVKMADKREQ